MLKLTDTYKDRTIYVNPAHIIVFGLRVTMSGEARGTNIVTLKETYNVKETPEDIADMISMANITIRL